METDERRLSQYPPPVRLAFGKQKRVFLVPGAGNLRFISKKISGSPASHSRGHTHASGRLPRLAHCIHRTDTSVARMLLGLQFHGKNSYQTDESQMPVETRKYRLRLWQNVIDAKRKWLADNGFTRKQPEARAFLDRWTLYLEKEEFCRIREAVHAFFLISCCTIAVMGRICHGVSWPSTISAPWHRSSPAIHTFPHLRHGA